MIDASFLSVAVVLVMEVRARSPKTGSVTKVVYSISFDFSRDLAIVFAVFRFAVGLNSLSLAFLILQKNIRYAQIYPEST